jgi:hypothetical protein
MPMPPAGPPLAPPPGGQLLPPGTDPNAMTPQLRHRLAQLLAAQQAQQGGVPAPGAPLPPSGGTAFGPPLGSPPSPNAGASNMSIQPGKARF